jgi:hypothetical protein
MFKHRRKTKCLLQKKQPKEKPRLYARARHSDAKTTSGTAVSLFLASAIGTEGATNSATNGTIRVDRNQVDIIRNQPFVPAWQKWREIGEMVVADLKANGHFVNSSQGLFFFDSEHKRVFPIYEDFGLGAVISNRYGINPREYGYKRVLADLQSEAMTNGASIEIRHLTHYDRLKNCLYVSQFNGFMYKLDGKSVLQTANGTDDVFFLDERAWEPYQYFPGTPKGQLDGRLIDSVNFDQCTLSVKEQRLFLKLWLIAVFFGNIQPTKIILLLLGEQGSGKTSALRRIQKLIYGPNVNLLSIEKDKPDGFVATVTSDPIALFDNLDEKIPWLPYNLSRLATGVTFPRRRLYTTNDKVEFPGVSWLGITARTVDFMQGQPDLPDRTLVLKLARLEVRKPEDELITGVQQHRGQIWSELLDELNRVIQHLKQSSQSEDIHFRMADFASLALKVADVWGRRFEVEKAFEKLEKAQAELVLKEEPISLTLQNWLQDPANRGRGVSAGTLFEELRWLAASKGSTWPIANSQALARSLGQLRTALQQEFRAVIDWDSHAKQNTYRFWPKETSEIQDGGANPLDGARSDRTEQVELSRIV